MRVRLLFSNLAAERAASLRKGARNEHEPQNGTSACALLCPAPARSFAPRLRRGAFRRMIRKKPKNAHFFKVLFFGYENLDFGTFVLTFSAYVL